MHVAAGLLSICRSVFLKLRDELCAILGHTPAQELLDLIQAALEIVRKWKAKRTNRP
jgi:hypothetical protein